MSKDSANDADCSGGGNLVTRRRVLQISGIGAATAVAGCGDLEADDGIPTSQRIAEEQIPPTGDYSFLLSVDVPTAFDKETGKVVNEIGDAGPLRAELMNFDTPGVPSSDMVIRGETPNSDEGEAELRTKFPVVVTWTAAPNLIDEVGITVGIDGRSAHSDMDGTTHYLPYRDVNTVFRWSRAMESFSKRDSSVTPISDKDSEMAIDYGRSLYGGSGKSLPQVGLAATLRIAIDFSDSNVFEQSGEIVKEIDVAVTAKPYEQISAKIFDRAETVRGHSETVAGEFAGPGEGFIAKAAQFYFAAGGFDGDIDTMEDLERAGNVTTKGITAIKEHVRSELEEGPNGEFEVGFAGPTIIHSGTDSLPEPGGQASESGITIARENTDGEVFQVGTLEEPPGEPLRAGESVTATIGVEAHLGSAETNIVYGVLGTLDGEVYASQQMDATGTGTVTVSTTLPADSSGKELIWTWIPASIKSEAENKYLRWAEDNQLYPGGSDTELSLGTIS